MAQKKSAKRPTMRRLISRATPQVEKVTAKDGQRRKQEGEQEKERKKERQREIGGGGRKHS